MGTAKRLWPGKKSSSAKEDRAIRNPSPPSLALDDSAATDAKASNFSEASVFPPLPQSDTSTPSKPSAAVSSVEGAVSSGRVFSSSHRQSLAWALGLCIFLVLHAFAARHAFSYLSTGCAAGGSQGAYPWHAAVLLSTIGAARGRQRPAAEGSSRDPAPEFFLYRVIGNNMPPLQCPSQLLWNTQYALDHEGPLPGCKKRWVVNKIVNETERALVIDSLLGAGYTMDDILIRWFNPAKVAKEPRERWLDVVTQQNEARNLAIEDGIRSGARWVLPFDGNHFITHESWAAIRLSAKMAEERNLKYFKVPVHRLYAEQEPSWVNSHSEFKDLIKKAPMMIESQLVFRNDAPERFKQGMVYGMQNKLEALSRICGTQEDSNYEEKCWCNDLGKEGQTHPSNLTVAKECGYSLRLWFYPCSGTDPMKVFKNGVYRKKLRTESRRKMYSWVKREVQAAMRHGQVQ